MRSPRSVADAHMRARARVAVLAQGKGWRVVWVRGDAPVTAGWLRYSLTAPAVRQAVERLGSPPAMVAALAVSSLVGGYVAFETRASVARVRRRAGK